MKAPTAARSQYLSHHHPKCCTTASSNASTNASATGRTRHQGGGGGGSGGKGANGGGGRGGRVMPVARRLSTIRVTFSQSMVNLAILDPATAAILAEQTRHLTLVSR